MTTFLLNFCFQNSHVLSVFTNKNKTCAITTHCLYDFITSVRELEKINLTVTFPAHLLLTHKPILVQCHISIPPDYVTKPKIFWHFQEV